MKYNKLLLKPIFPFLFFCLINKVYSQAMAGDRPEIDLAENYWTLRLDTKASWQNDNLYLPPVNIEKLPVNQPTNGWDSLRQQKGKKIKIPATVEQFFWNRNDNPFGICGDYVGVSWFSAKTTVPKEFKGKRLVLWVESVRSRAEIFVNEKLVGYDLINGTPFQVDITDAIKPGQENTIDFRITDPNGNFNWKDSQPFSWGNYLTVPSHGFGGITGQVKILATDSSYIEDVFVKNKPEINEVDIQVTTSNDKQYPINGQLTFILKEHKKNDIVYSKTYSLSLSPSDTTISNLTIRLESAKLWSVDNPDLYDLYVSWQGGGDEDVFYRRFGFRWFEIREVGNDRQFYLNNKRIVLRSAISWGFWPINGITPSDSLAKKQIEIAKKLGLNMLNFHRQIGQAKVLDYADELGLLYFEEPGGNKYPGSMYYPTDPLGKMQSSFYLTFRNERIARMVKRDRNHPSLIIYNLHNERGENPQAADSIQLQIAHNLDETRIVTYNSSNGENPTDRPDARFKLHLRPYDYNFYISGWWDEHHAGGPGVYHDNLYNGPSSYLRKPTHSDEIIFWGEDGAIGTPPRLQLIRNEILKLPEIQGWQSHDYLKWYNVYDNFLKEQGFAEAFPTVDDLTQEIGNVSFYYQGRIIENIRINNIVDGYVINGWESIKLENHSGVVDNYRNPKGDIEVLAKYNEPLYVAVKIRDKVLPVGDTAVVDCHIVNETNLKGTYQLLVEAFDEKGAQIFTTLYKKVKVTGGNTFGELLKEKIVIPVKTEGYTTISAQLIQNKKTFAEGNDQLFAVRFNPPVNPGKGMIADTSGILKRFLEKANITDIEPYDPGHPKGKWLLVGAENPPDQWGAGISRLLEWVYKGNSLVIVHNADKWAEFLSNKEILDYRGSQTLGKSWFGGNYFVKGNPYFTGLPVNCAFNWEYQSLATYNKNRYGLRIYNGKTLVGCVSDHKKEIYSAFSVIPAGRGKIMITSLDLFSCLQDFEATKTKIDEDGLNASVNTYNTSSKNKANIVAQQLLLNILTVQ